MQLPGIAMFRLCTINDEQLIERVAEQLNEMYESGKIPSRHIPAQPNNDFDLLVAELILRFNETRKAN